MYQFYNPKKTIIQETGHEENAATTKISTCNRSSNLEAKIGNAMSILANNSIKKGMVPKPTPAKETDRANGLDSRKAE